MIDDGTIDAADGAVGVARFGVEGGWPVLWFHGGLSSRLDARFLHAAAVEAGAHVVAFDRPGTGRSARRLGFTVAGWAATACELMVAAGVERFTAVGWSAGRPYALAAAAARADLVTWVVTVAGMCPIDDPERLGELGLRTDRLLFPLAHRRPRMATRFKVVPNGLLDLVLSQQRPERAHRLG